jgi:hypothetical protein
MLLKSLLIGLAGLLATSRAAPVADPEAFLDLGAIAIPAITGSALVDGLILGKLAFLKSAILANILLNLGGEEEVAYDSYGPPDVYEAPVDSYGAPAVSYEEPAPAYGAPVDEYGPPAAPPVEYAPPADEYGSPAAPALSN